MSSRQARKPGPRQSPESDSIAILPLLTRGLLTWPPHRSVARPSGRVENFDGVLTRKLNQSPQPERALSARVSRTKSVRHPCAFTAKALCVSLGLLVTLIACHRSKQKVIAIVPKGQGHIFWQTVHAGAKAAGEKFGVTVLWNGPASEIEISKQINILEDFINRRVDGIVVAPSDQKALVPVIESAVRRGIPVTIFDSGAETESYVSFVSTDNYQGGVKAAHRMAEVLNKKGNVAIVGVMPGSASTTQRENGFKETIAKEYPQLKIVAFQYGMSDRARSLAVTEDILTANPNLDGIFGPNESSSIGAAQAVKGRGLTGKVKVVGFDSSPSLTTDLQEGVIDSLIVQNPFAMGFEGVRTICEKLDGKSPERRIDTGVTVVTKSNLSDPKIQQLINPSLEKYLGSQ